MASNVKKANAGVNAEADAIGALLDSGYIRLYTASQPATGDTAITDQTLLAELRFGATAFAGAVAGVITANAITSEDAALATGTAVWARLLESDGTTPVTDCSVGTADADIILNSVAIQEDAEVSITALTLTVPKSA